MNLGISKTQQFTSLNSAYCFRSFPMKHDLFTSTEAIWGCRIVYPVKSKTKGLDLSTVHHLQSFQLQGRPFHSQSSNKLDESMYRSFIQLLHQVKWFIRQFIRPTSVSKSWSTPLLFCFHQIRKLSPCFVGFIPQAFKLYSAICR